MSGAYPLVVAFSQPQLRAPVNERINVISSFLLYLRRESVTEQPTPQGNKSLSALLSPFLSASFHEAVDSNRAALEGGEVYIPIGAEGIQQLDYILEGRVATLELTPEQQEVVRDLGFTVQPRAAEPVAALV
jgi:hypothetical protein